MFVPHEFITCLCIGFFGVLAAIFGIAAELKHVKADDVVMVAGDDCFYPAGGIPWLMAILAASSLLLSQLIATVSSCAVGCAHHRSSCIYVTTTSKNKIATPLLCFLLSWISFANAMFLLLEGATINGHLQIYGQGMVHTCYVIKPGVLGAGAALSILTCILSIIYYRLIASMNTPDLLLEGSATVPCVNAHMLPAFCFNPEYSTRAWHTSHPVAYVAGLELPKRYDPTC